MSEHIRRRITYEEEVIRRAAGLYLEDAVYDPALDVIKHEIERGQISSAMNRAREIANRNEAAGYVGYELVKFAALELGWSGAANDAATQAARLRLSLLDE